MSNTNLNSSLNTQLDSPITWNTVVSSRHYIFTGTRNFEIISFDEDTGLGVAQSPNARFMVAFKLGDVAKPVACRDYRAELKVEMFEIDTVCNAEGTGIEGAIGAKFAGKWRVIAFS